MAKQAPPAAAEPAAKEPAAEPAPLEDPQKIIEAKDAALQELARKLADAREEVNLCKAELDRKIEENAEMARHLEGFEASSKKILAERDAFARELASIKLDLEHKTQSPSDRRACVALVKMRSPFGWVSAGDEFDASDEELEGYVEGTHFNLRG